MSEFLMIVPEGWIEADVDLLLTVSDEGTLANYAANEPVSIDTLLGDTGQLEQGKTLSAVRLFKDGDRLRLWYQVIDIPPNAE